VWGVLWRPAAAALMAGASLFLIRTNMALTAHALWLAGGGMALYALLYLAFWLVLPGGSERVGWVMQTVTQLWDRRPAKLAANAAA
jgi:hypothetical protein